MSPPFGPGDRSLSSAGNPCAALANSLRTRLQLRDRPLDSTWAPWRLVLRGNSAAVTFSRPVNHVEDFLPVGQGDDERDIPDPLLAETQRLIPCFSSPEVDAWVPSTPGRRPVPSSLPRPAGRREIYTRSRSPRYARESRPDGDRSGLTPTGGVGPGFGNRPHERSPCSHDVGDRVPQSEHLLSCAE